MKALPARLPNGRIWLRLADPEWSDPLDPSYAQEHGGRWNPPGAFATLYLNGDLRTAHLQLERMLAGSPVRPDDLDDGAYELIAARLPRAQVCADAVTPAGLRALGLSERYPRDSAGRPVGHEVCRPAGARIRGEGLRGVWCCSACTADGHGRELTWYPATHRSLARPVWDVPLPLGRWRFASRWTDIGLNEQPDSDRPHEH